MKKISLAAAALCAVALVGCGKEEGPQASTKTKLETNSEKISYLAGYGMGQQLGMGNKQDSTMKADIERIMAGASHALGVKDTTKSYLLGMMVALQLKMKLAEGDTAYKMNPEVVLQALKEGFSQAGKPDAKPLLSQEEMQKVGQAYQEALAEKQFRPNKLAGEGVLAKNKTAPGVKETPSGLQIQVLQAGSGPTLTDSDIALIKYKGTLVDGKVFDQRDSATDMPVAGVIPGFSEALKTMNVGTKIKVWIPWKIAYGAQGNQAIPPFSMLQFDVELVGIKKAPVAPAPQPAAAAPAPAPAPAGK